MTAARKAEPGGGATSHSGVIAAAGALGLLPAEISAIVAELGRLPNPTELAMLAAMWSEHCSYKSTRHLLKTLPTAGAHVLAGPGAHAGVVDVGEGWAVAFKIESHNHPSAVDPYQGAATGVGGILRDILAQGARPCAILDSLCFGLPGDARAAHLRAGITAGIAGYGNAVGVPTVGGRTVYDRRYGGNPLVNVLAAGLVRHDALRGARAEGAGNLLLYVGATTGRDGVLGAAFASESLSTESAGKRARVQVGDPFAGKKLLEACLSFDAESGMLAGQDLGAAGLTCAASEMAALSGIGIELDLTAIPLREPGMTPQEILLSESQERFLFIIRAEKAAEAIAHFERFGVLAACCGQTTNTGRIRVDCGADGQVELPAELLARGAPPSRWPVADSLPRVAALPDFPAPSALSAALRELLAQPGIADHARIYSQFDQTVGNRTVRGPGQASAAVLRLPGSRRGFALTVTGRGPLCAIDPYRGTQAAVAEALRDLACAGARLVAVSDGLNFASPRNPVENRRISGVIAGLADALRTLGIPVTGGNVSLYNESPAGAIPPTPMIGALGTVEDVGRVPLPGLSSGDALFLVGRLRSEPVASHYGAIKTRIEVAGSVDVDLAGEARLARFLLAQNDLGRVRACKGSGSGGLGVALAKLCVRGGCGAVLTLPPLPDVRADWLLFGEYAAQAWVTVAPEHVEAFSRDAQSAEIPIWHACIASGSRLLIGGGQTPLVDLTLAELRAALGIPAGS